MPVLRTDEGAVDGDVIAQFSRMYRFSEQWGSAKDTELSS